MGVSAALRLLWNQFGAVVKGGHIQSLREAGDWRFSLPHPIPFFSQILGGRTGQGKRGKWLVLSLVCEHRRR